MHTYESIKEQDSKGVLPDVQNRKAAFSLTKVGVRHVKVPILFDTQSCQAECAAYIYALNNKGANLSRLIEVLTSLSTKPLTFEILKSVAEALFNTHNHAGLIKIKFNIFNTKAAPVSKKVSYIHYPCEISIKDQSKYVIGIQGLGTTVCPCSLEITNSKGAHNQRATINLKVEVVETAGLNLVEVCKKLINIADTSSSCEIYNILKRADEKFVTEKMFSNPCFSEDCARNAATALKELKYIKNFSVVVESYESIHSHNCLSIYDTKENLHAV